MKKILIIILSLFVYIINVYAEDTNFQKISQTSETIMDVKHTELIANFSYENSDYPQVINILEGNNRIGSPLKVFTSDSYQPFGWGLGDLKAKAFNLDDPDYMVVGGINGDFYDTSTGQPCELYVRNGEVVYAGYGNDWDSVCVKGNGAIAMGNPETGDLKVYLYNERGNLLDEVKIDNINSIPNDGDVSVYFDTYVGSINEDITKFIIDAEDVKIAGSSYFGKGLVEDITEGETSVESQKMVVVSKNNDLNSQVEKGLKIVVQRELLGQFMGCEWAIGAYGALVKYGKIVDNIESVSPTSRNPRTAIGVKLDGTIVMVTVDGRQENQGMYGVSLYELAEIMLDLGCETAYNLDGGGSTTMILRNEETNRLDIMNSPSDGHIRSISNGIFFVVPKPRNEVPPTIFGTPDKFVLDTQDDIPNWLDGVFAQDDEDINVDVLIDDSDVDLTTPGTYQIKYIAIDSSNNEKVITVDVLVNDRITTTEENSTDITTIDMEPINETSTILILSLFSLSVGISAVIIIGIRKQKL